MAGHTLPPSKPQQPQRHNFTQISRNQASPTRSRTASAPHQQSQVSPPGRSRISSTPQQQTGLSPNPRTHTSQTPTRTVIGSTKQSNNQPDSQVMSPGRSRVTSSPGPQSNPSPIRSRLASAPLQSSPASYNRANPQTNGFNQKFNQRNGQSQNIQQLNGNSQRPNTAAPGYSFNANSCKYNELCSDWLKNYVTR